jgi:hypothetical protein
LQGLEALGDIKLVIASLETALSTRARAAGDSDDAIARALAR